jgi:hypothetical protein
LHTEFGAQFIKRLANSVGKAVGRLSGKSPLGAEEAGEGAGTGHDEAGHHGQVLRGEVIRGEIVPAEPGHDAPEGDAYQADPVIQGGVMGTPLWVGEFAVLEDAAAIPVLGAVLVAPGSAGADIPATVGGAQGRVGVSDRQGRPLALVAAHLFLFGLRDMVASRDDDGDGQQYLVDSLGGWVHGFFSWRDAGVGWLSNGRGNGRLCSE